MRHSADAYEQAQEARVILEIEAARLAAERRTAADLDVMRAIIDKSRISLREGKNLADDDEAFHLALIAAAKNPVLLRIAKSLYLITRSVRIAYFDLPGAAKSSLPQHERMLESLEAGDQARAVDLMRQHYRLSTRYWRRAKKPRLPSQAKRSRSSVPNSEVRLISLLIRPWVLPIIGTCCARAENGGSATLPNKKMNPRRRA